MVAVAPGAAAAPDGPSGDGTLESLLEGPGDAGERVRSAGRARSGAPEARTTTIDLSAAADPVPRGRGVVPIRHIVGARPPSGRWLARARRSVRVGAWVAAAVTVGAGLVALWVLLFTTVSGGDVWLGRPLTPARHDENATQPQNGPAGAGAAPVRPSQTAAPPKPSTAATKASKAAAPTHTSGKSGGSATATSGSGGSGRNGADDPPGDDSATRVSTSTATSGSGSGSSGSGSGHGSGGGSGSSGSSGGHGSDD